MNQLQIGVLDTLNDNDRLSVAGIADARLWGTGTVTQAVRSLALMKCVRKRPGHDGIPTYEITAKGRAVLRARTNKEAA